MLATLEVQRAIYETLTSYGLSVYSTLPINTPMPYVQFTTIQVLDNSNKSIKRQSYHISLSAWCLDTTSMNIHQMVAKVLDLMDAELNLGEEFSHDNTELETVQISQDEVTTKIINRAIIDFRVDVSEN